MEQPQKHPEIQPAPQKPEIKPVPSPKVPSPGRNPEINPYKNDPPQQRPSEVPQQPKER